MKTTIIACLAVMFLLSSCNNDKTKTTEASDKGTAGFTSEDTNRSGTYSVDGQSYKGKITLQKMAKDQYSVLCQQDEPFSMLQLVFASEKDARSNTVLKAGSNFYSMGPGEVHVAVTIDGKEFTTNSNSTGSISVGDNSVALKDLVLFDMEKKETKTVNSSLSF